MSLQVEKLEKNMAKLTIEVPAEELEAAIEQAYQKNKGRIQIPGFRKGKVPRKLIEQMYGKSFFYEDAANALIPEAYEKAVEECTETIVSSPKIDVTQIEAGTQHNVVPDTCRFVVDVRTTDAYSNEETVGILRAALRSDAVPRSTRIRAAAVGGEHPLVKAAVAAGRETYVSPTTSDRTLMPFPALKMGPGQSSRSHTADEFVLLEEIAEGIAVYEKYIGKLAQEYGWKTLG